MFTELNPVAQHQLVTSPAPPGGLLPVSVTGSGRPSPIITVPSQGTHKSIAVIGAGRWSNRLWVIYAAAVMSLTNKTRLLVLIFINQKNRAAVPAGCYEIPHLQQYWNVSGHAKTTVQT
jgi:hypothetical protein